MPTFGTEALTLMDLHKRYKGSKDGIDSIIEVLNQANPIMQDLRFKEGNLPTGNLTTQRTALPNPHVRAINRGVPNTKSSTKQVTDTAAMLEDRSSVDVKLLMLSNDPMRFRQTEDAAHIEGFGQTVASMLFYGDTDVNVGEFNGLAKRYNVLSTDKTHYGYQNINMGGTAAGKCGSIWIVCHGDDGVMGIYPRGSKAGLTKKDLGETDAVDFEGNKFRVVETLFSWDVGLTVADPRRVAAIRNIDVSQLASATASQRQKFIESFIYAKGRIRNLDSGRIKPVAYVPQEIKTALEIALTDKNNIHVTRQEVMGEMPKLYVAGIEVKACDVLRTDEDPIANV